MTEQLMNAKLILPEMPFVCWVYDSPGEPAFELRFDIVSRNGAMDTQDCVLTVIPMHMDGHETEPTKIVSEG